MTPAASGGDPLRYDGDKAHLTSTVDEEHRTVTVLVSGQLDTDNSPAVARVLQRAFDLVPAPHLVVMDLRDLRYASSTGIGVIARLYVEAHRRSVELEVCNVPANVKTVFDLLGFSTFFTFTTRP